jgi:hypothetical protein
MIPRPDTGRLGVSRFVARFAAYDLSGTVARAIRRSELTCGKAEMPDQHLSKSRLRWFRLSVRGFIVLILIIGAGLSRLVHGARLQRDAVAAIRKAGGSAFYNWENPLKCGGTKSRDLCPRWLVDHLGVDYFGHVKWVVSDASNVDSLLIGHLNQVRILDLHGSALTDDGLSCLRSLTRVENIQLRGTKVTDVGLGQLEGFASLALLDISETGVSDAGLNRLKLLPHLEWLNLRGSRVTDVGVRSLQTALPHLEIVR